MPSRSGSGRGRPREREKRTRAPRPRRAALRRPHRADASPCRAGQRPRGRVPRPQRHRRQPPRSEPCASWVADRPWPCPGPGCPETEDEAIHDRPRAWAAPTAASHLACRSPRRRHVARAEPSGQARGGDQEMKEVVGGIDGNSHSTWSPVTKPQIVTARYSAPNPSAYARAESRRRHRARPSRPERMCTMLCQPFTRRR
jgi:hypothetical protein